MLEIFLLFCVVLLAFFFVLIRVQIDKRGERRFPYDNFIIRTDKLKKDLDRSYKILEELRKDIETENNKWL
jgi:hypothetical protein